MIGDAASGILPLTLLNFEAKASATGNAVLNWHIAHEVNTGYFELQMSTDSYNFTTIAKVQAKGTPVGEVSYSYTNKGLQAGLYYYRLRVVDKDGKETYSLVVSLNLKEKNTITLFPVPAKGNMV